MPAHLPPLPPAETITFAHVASYGLSVTAGCDTCRHESHLAQGSRCWSVFKTDDRPIMWLWGEGLVACHKCAQPFESLTIEPGTGNLLFRAEPIGRWWLGMGVPPAAQPAP